MATPDRQAIDTFVSITGASELIALQKLQEHAGNLNEAVDAYFSEGDRNITNVPSTVVPQDDLMDIDDPVQVEPSLQPLSLLSSARNLYPFSLFNHNLIRSIFDSVTDRTSGAPVVSHPREVREIPIEVRDGNEQSRHSGLASIIQDITGTTHEHDPGIGGTVTFDEDDDFATARIAPWVEGNRDSLDDYAHVTNYRPSAPGIDDLPGYNNDIEEEMIQAAIQASKLDAEIPDLHQIDPMPQQSQSHQEDAELEHAVFLSLKTAEEENAARVMSDKFVQSEAFKSGEVNVQGEVASYGRLEVGESTSQKSVSGYRDRIISTNSVNLGKEAGETEWGGISTSERKEAVILEAALFGGVSRGSLCHVPSSPHQSPQRDLGGGIGPYRRQMSLPPTPSLTSQRLTREQQDDEYLASLQADREKELRGREEAETRRLKEHEAREVALENEKKKEDESRKKMAKEQEMERQLAAKENRLPPEPPSDDENAVTLLVRMPDGSRLGRRFLKSHKLQYLFDFIDVARVVKPGTYRLIRPYPRRAFTPEENAANFNELGFSSKQEALFLELI